MNFFFFLESICFDLHVTLKKHGPRVLSSTKAYFGYCIGRDSSSKLGVFSFSQNTTNPSKSAGDS